jgi:hypothetical protein
MVLLLDTTDESAGLGLHMNTHCTGIECVGMKAIDVSLSSHSPTESRHCMLHCHSAHKKQKLMVKPCWQYTNKIKHILQLKLLKRS